MRHTFTMEQKRILLQSFESGMVGQSMAYHEKIADCAQKSGLDFDTVKNWVGNQRRKRRMEEMQMYAGHEQQLGSISPQIPYKYKRTADGQPGPQKQVQCLYFPRSSGEPVNLHPKPVDTFAPPQGPRLQYSAQEVHTPMSRPVLRGAPMHLHHPVPPGIRQQHITLTHNHPRIPLPPPVTSHGIPNPRMQLPARLINPHRALNGPRLLPGTRNEFVAPQLQSDSMNVSHGNFSDSDRSQGQPAPQPQDPGQPVSHGESPGAYQVSQDGSEYSSDGTVENSAQRHPPNSGMESYDSTHASKVDCDWRDLQIQRIIETIQIYVDQLNKLGCEAFLASVSKDTLSTFLCGTPMGNSYFTEINQERPLSEYVESKITQLGPEEAEGDQVVVLDSHNSPEQQDSEVTPELDQEGEAGVSSELDQEAGTESGADLDQEGEAELNIEINAEGSIAVTLEEDPESADHGDQIDGQTAEEAEEDTAVEKLEADVTTDGSGGPCKGEEQGRIIRAGEEVYIVNKRHFVIGRGTLLPAPHQKIMLKNVHTLVDDSRSSSSRFNHDGFIEEKYS